MVSVLIAHRTQLATDGCGFHADDFTSVGDGEQVSSNDHYGNDYSATHHNEAQLQMSLYRQTKSSSAE